MMFMPKLPSCSLMDFIDVNKRCNQDMTLVPTPSKSHA